MGEIRVKRHAQQPALPVDINSCRQIQINGHRGWIGDIEHLDFVFPNEAPERRLGY
jgi:hypothetical protein